MKIEVDYSNNLVLLAFHRNNIFCLTHFTSLLNWFDKIRKYVKVISYYKRNVYSRPQSAGFKIYPLLQLFENLFNVQPGYHPEAIVVDTDRRDLESKLSDYMLTCFKTSQFGTKFCYGKFITNQFLAYYVHHSIS